MSIIKHERRQVIQTHAIRSEHSAIRYGLSRQPPVSVNLQTVKTEMLELECKPDTRIVRKQLKHSRCCLKWKLRKKLTGSAGTKCLWNSVKSEVSCGSYKSF